MMSITYEKLNKNPTRNLNRSMAVYCFSVAWWSGWECAALQMPTRELAGRLLHVEYAGVVFIPTLLCTTVSYLVDLPSTVRRRLLLPLYFLSTGFLFVLSIFPMSSFLSVSQGSVYYLPVWGKAGPYYWSFLVFFLGAILAAHVLVFYRWTLAGRQERVRLALFTVGSVFAYLGGCPEFALKYGVRLGWLNPFGLYAFPIYIALLTYAVLQHQLFDIHIVIRRSLVYSILVTFLTVGYFGLTYSVEKLFQTTLGYQSVWISLVAFAAMALAFQPLKVGIQRFVDWLIFRKRHEELVKHVERLEQEALQAEKFKAISTLAAGMAHEIKNPLTALKAFTEFFPEKRNDPAFLDKLHQVLTTEVNRVHGIVGELLEFAKPKSPQLKPVDLEPILQSTVDFLSNELLKHKIQWQVDCQHNGATIQADSDQLRQVLINLIQNAADAMPQGGILTLATQTVPGHLELTVSDTGQGIPKDLLQRIFDPFVTTKPNGYGLGLAVVYSIVQSHRGTIHAASSPGRGTTFTLRFPL